MGTDAMACGTVTAILANVPYGLTDDAAIGCAAVKQNGDGGTIGAKIGVVAEKACSRTKVRKHEQTISNIQAVKHGHYR